MTVEKKPNVFKNNSLIIVVLRVSGCNQEAEEMHIKAIQIKEQLLGHEDYEVALSVGHLASLYNYDMNQYEDAERLYLRSIAIGQTQGWDGSLMLAVTFFFFFLSLSGFKQQHKTVLTLLTLL